MFRYPQNSYYSRFDDTVDESAEDPIDPPLPRTLQEVMKDVIIFVDYRSVDANRTIGIKNFISSLGIIVNDRLLR